MRRSIALAISIPLVSVPAAAADRWVAPGGSDSGAGSSSAPWATLQYAADTVQPGDTVHVKDGSYVGFHVDAGGTQASPIAFVAEGAGAIISQRNSMTSDGINVENADWVTIDGFVTNGMPRAGVRCALSNHVTVRRVHADSNTVWGIFSGFCDDFVVEDNVTSRSAEQHGIYVSNSAQRPIVRRNVIFDNYACGLHMNGDLSMGGVGTIDGALVEQNVIYGNGRGGGSAINGDGLNGSVIQNNLVYDTHASGISIYQIDASAPGKNNQILHNTIVVASDGRWALNIVNGSSNNTAKYNVLLNLNAGHGAYNMDAASLTGLVSDYNVVTPKFTGDDGSTMLDLAGWRALGYDASSIAGDSTVFTNAAGGEYKLAAGSSPIDKAVGSTLGMDLEGHVRPFGSTADIGCYEWGSTAMVSDAGVPPVDAVAPPSDTGKPVTPPADAASDGRVSTGSGGSGPVIGTDAGAAPATAPTGEDSGCGCRHPGRIQGTLGWLATALALVAARARRRARA